MLMTQTQTQKRTPWRMAGYRMPCLVDQEPVHRSQANTALHLRRSAHHPREPLHHPPPHVSSRNRAWKKENRSTLLYYCKRQESAPLRTHLTKVTKKAFAMHTIAFMPHELPVHAMAIGVTLLRSHKYNSYDQVCYLISCLYACI